MLQHLGIESRLQLAITLCVAALIIVTTLGTSGGAPVVFFIYRTLLISIAILCTIGSRRADLRISAMFLAWVTVLFLLMRSEEHTSELQSRFDLVCRLLL